MIDIREEEGLGNFSPFPSFFFPLKALYMRKKNKKNYGKKKIKIRNDNRSKRIST